MMCPPLFLPSARKSERFSLRKTTQFRCCLPHTAGSSPDATKAAEKTESSSIRRNLQKISVKNVTGHQKPAGSAEQSKGLSEAAGGRRKQ